MGRGRWRAPAPWCGGAAVAADAGRACGRHGVLRFPERPTTMCRPPLRCVDGYCAAEGAGEVIRRGPKHARHPQVLDDSRH
ncbi:Protein of unknown function [Gryllus bimaculatus]|nr:Protein of unknown function [Gryllus bimaculatus]